MFFISYAKNFFVPPSDFGVGSPRPIRDLPSAFNAGVGDRPRIAFVNNGFTGGDIGAVIDDTPEMTAIAFTFGARAGPNLYEAS